MTDDHESESHQLGLFDKIVILSAILISFLLVVLFVLGLA